MSIHDTTDIDATGSTEPKDHELQRSNDLHRDRLTILRLLILTAGVAVGIVFFAPAFNGEDAWDSEKGRGLANAVLIGLALPAPLFCVRWRCNDRRIGAGGLFALTTGLGSLLMFPAEVIEWLGRATPVLGADDMPVTCLFYCLPLVGLWYLLAALLSGHVGRRLFTAQSAWTERYGFLLALLWSPLGAWVLVDIYRDVL